MCSLCYTEAHPKKRNSSTCSHSINSIGPRHFRARRQSDAFRPCLADGTEGDRLVASGDQRGGCGQRACIDLLFVSRGRFRPPDKSLSYLVVVRIEGEDGTSLRCSTPAGSSPAPYLPYLHFAFGGYTRCRWKGRRGVQPRVCEPIRRAWCFRSHCRPHRSSSSSWGRGESVREVVHKPKRSRGVAAYPRD